MPARYACDSRAALSLVFAATLVAVVVLPAASPCSDTIEDGAPGVFGMPNPAAFYCRELGYEYEIVRTPEGEAGVCVLPDGRRVDAWEFFRGVVGWEHNYCARLGLRTEVRGPGDGDFAGDCAVCVSEDGSEFGTVWALMGLGERMTPRVDAGELRTTPPRAFSATRDLPESFDWSELGGCTPVKNQGQCGSCWAFSAVGCLESDIKIKDGIDVDLSEQWLVSCNTDGWTCNGGNFAHRYHQWKPDPCGWTGAVLEADFPYAAETLPCGCPYPHEYVLDGWGHLAGSEGIPTIGQMKEAVLEHGPIDVAVFADENFSAYTHGIFRQCEYEWQPNHTVVLVGWDDNQGTEGIWKLKNSWGPFWGEGGYMRIEYGCSYIGYGACWTSYREPLLISYPEGRPHILLPHEETRFLVRVSEVTDTCVPGSVALHCRLGGGGSFSTFPLRLLGDGVYEAVLPPADCLHVPEYYVSVDGARYGTVTEPARAPEETHRAWVGSPTVLFEDDFESHQGWTVNNDSGLLDGSWERGVPVGGGLRGDPATDYDGSGSCFLTGNEAGNSDVDGGVTRLISPQLHVDRADEVVVEYALWYTNDRGNNPNQDRFKVYVLQPQDWWTVADVVGPQTPTPTKWRVGALALSDYIDFDDGFWFRFDASDTSPWSVVEAGVDAVRVTALKCDPTGLEGESDPPGRPVLHAARPNPFAATSVIAFEIPRESGVKVAVYDAAGRLVRRLLTDASAGPGPHQLVWDGRDDAGRAVASGTYFCKLTVDGETVAGKMVLLK